MDKVRKNLFARAVDRLRKDEDAGPLSGDRGQVHECARVSRKGKPGLLLSELIPEYVRESITSLSGFMIGDAYFFENKLSWDLAMREVRRNDEIAIKSASYNGSTRLFNGSLLYRGYDILPDGFRRVNNEVIAAPPGEEASDEQIAAFRERGNLFRVKEAYRHDRSVTVSDDGEVSMPAHHSAAVTMYLLRNGGVRDRDRIRIPADKVKNGDFDARRFKAYARRVEVQEKKRRAEEEKASIMDYFSDLGIDVFGDPDWVTRNYKDGRAMFIVPDRATGLLSEMRTAGAVVSPAGEGNVTVSFSPKKFDELAPILSWVRSEIELAEKQRFYLDEKSVAHRKTMPDYEYGRSSSRGGSDEDTRRGLDDHNNPLSLTNPASPLSPSL